MCGSEMRPSWLLLLSLILLCGCQELQVRQKSNLLMATVPSLYYQEVVDNLALISVNEQAIPFFATPTQGTNQQSRQLQMSSVSAWGLITNASAPIFGLLDQFLFTSQQASITPQIQNVQTFQLSPVIEASKLSTLQIAFRIALGAPTTNYEVFRLGQAFNAHRGPYSNKYFEAITGMRLPPKEDFEPANAKAKFDRWDNLFTVPAKSWIHTTERKRE